MREYQFMTATKYGKALGVGKYVMSVHHIGLGRSTFGPLSGYG